MAGEPPLRRELPQSIRGRFPIFESTVYLNSCSQGALSDAVRSAYAAYLDDWDERGAPWEYWVEQAELARASFADLVNAKPDEIAVTTSLSAGVSALISGLEVPGRRKIVISDFEFPTIGQIAHAQELRGWEVAHVPEADDGTIPLERFDAVIDEETALVAVAYICYRNGSRLDIEGLPEDLMGHLRKAHGDGVRARACLSACLPAPAGLSQSQLDDMQNRYGVTWCRG